MDSPSDSSTNSSPSKNWAEKLDEANAEQHALGQRPRKKILEEDEKQHSASDLAPMDCAGS
ncbi:hypothetical protein MW887_009299 [Aspergillus wentii]|nr:hypothetical protein MW887_009299 [Aspergillus wentii]